MTAWTEQCHVSVHWAVFLHFIGQRWIQECSRTPRRDVRISRKSGLFDFFFENCAHLQFEVGLLQFTLCTCIWNFRPRLTCSSGSHNTVLYLIGNLKASYFCRILDKFTLRAKPMGITSFRKSGVLLFQIKLRLHSSDWPQRAKSTHSLFSSHFSILQNVFQSSWRYEAIVLLYVNLVAHVEGGA
jgi:hypothetical protein